MNASKNISASVKARLQNVAATRGEDFNLLLLRYGIERLLFRLSRSPHADRFLLKGAMLFVVWDEKTHRPTRDLDLLGFGSTEKADLIRVFVAVAAVPVVDDGIVFDPKSVQADDVREDNALRRRPHPVAGQARHRRGAGADRRGRGRCRHARTRESDLSRALGFSRTADSHVSRLHGRRREV